MTAEQLREYDDLAHLIAGTAPGLAIAALLAEVRHLKDQLDAEVIGRNALIRLHEDEERHLHAALKRCLDDQ